MVTAIKKTFYHPKRDTGAREKFQEEIAQIPKDKLIFIDESGIEDNACIDYGWSKKGTRCYGEKTYRHKKRISMIAGLHDNKIIAPLIFEGNCDKDIFESYVEQILIRNLRAGQTVILDNISFHKTPRVRILIESVGCKVLYLPTYSPDLNPIEHYWFKIKHNIRKISHMFTDFSDAVCFILKNVSTFVY